METQISILLLNSFIRFFEGNTEKYGSHTYNNLEKIVEGVKEEGTWSGWVKDKYANFVKPTPETYKKHLAGTEAMGVCPIRSGNKVKFVVMDYDPYKKKEDTNFNARMKKMVNYIYTNNFPLMCFKSKSGGLHMYMFFSEEIPAKTARVMMSRFLPLLNLPLKTEIFPKQDRLKGDDSGNWINLPYFNADAPRAYLFGNDLDQMSLKEAINLIESKLQTPESIDDFFNSLDYADAPPCLQALALQGGVTENRNIYLFNFAVYLKSKYGKETEFVTQLLQTNSELSEPLPVREVTNSIINSHQKQNYAYKCKEEPLCSHCNKKECKAREFGIGQGAVSDLDYETLTQYKAIDSAYYEWKVNGVILTFKDEAEIIQQDVFRKQCFRKLHMLPMKLKQETWTNIINISLENIEVKTIGESEDMTPAAMLKIYLKDFLIGRAMAINKEQILIGKVFYSPQDFAYLFRKADLHKFLIVDKKFLLMSVGEIQRKLREINHGGDNGKVIKINGKSVRVTSIPRDFITSADTAELKDEELEVDFKKYNEQPF